MSFEDKLLKSLRDKTEFVKPSEFAEERISLSSAVTNMPGKFSYDLTPYSREIVNTLSPYHPAKIVVIKKGSQIGLTQGLIIPGITWLMENNPCLITLFTADEDLLKDMVNVRLDEAIKSADLQHLIGPTVRKKKNQRTGDTLKGKEFAGGKLFLGSLKSVNKLSRQNSFKIGFFDDWSSSDVSFKKEGNMFDLLQQRFSHASQTMKQFYISTPETTPDNIDILYERGDKRIWMLPCPLCHEYIEIKFSQIKYEHDKKNRLVEGSIYYECQECKGHFKEKEKYAMNLKGIWRPTAEPSEPGFYSYHISALVGPPNAHGWTKFVRDWLKANPEPNRVSISSLKVFVNQVLGEAWKEQEKKIKSNALANNTRNYNIGTVPNELSNKDGNGDIVLLTCTCDLNGKLNDGRLDYEVLAWSENESTYSIDASSIGTFRMGDEKTREKWTYRNEIEKNNIWDYFFKEVIDKNYYINGGGNAMRIFRVGIDVGHLSRYAWKFIKKKSDLCYGIKGDSHKIKSNKDFRKFKFGVSESNLFLIQTDKYKDELAEKIEQEWKKDGSIQPYGFMNFPRSESGKYTVKGYFKQYENETKQIEVDENGEATGWTWRKKYESAPNHFWDVAVYQLALKDIIVLLIGRELKQKDFSWADLVNLIK